MVMKYFLFKTGLGLALITATTLMADDPLVVVDFGQCIADSKYGKEEQKNLEKIRSQLSSLISETDKELQELNAKFEDTTFLDSLSPKAEEELRTRHQTLSEDRQRYQWQFGQIMQQAQNQFYHRIVSQIAKASEKLAEERQLDYVINKEACFYYRPNLDLTSQVIHEMDLAFDQDGGDKQAPDVMYSDAGSESEVE
jgi:outer membrane protein